MARLHGWGFELIKDELRRNVWYVTGQWENSGEA